MKPNSSTKRRTRTTGRNLEPRFDRGEAVLDYFDPARAIVSHGGARPGAGRKPSGKVRKMVKLSPATIRRVRAFARRERLPDFSAALEEAVRRL